MHNVNLSFSIFFKTWIFLYHFRLSSFRCFIRVLFSQEAKPCPPHPLLDQQRNRVRCTDAIEEAKRLADQHKLPDARALLQKATAGIDASPSGQDEYCRCLVLVCASVVIHP